MDLKTRSRAVSPAPPLPDQSPRSTTSSTGGIKQVVDDFQIVIGSWDEAKRSDVEHEIRQLFNTIDVGPLLTKFARAELLYTNQNFVERRLGTLKTLFNDCHSAMAGQHTRTLWVTRNRSREERDKIRALVSIKDCAEKHISEIMIDLDWRVRLWIRGEQVLHWRQFQKPGEGSMMLPSANGDETGWWVDVVQLARLLSLQPDRVRQEFVKSF